MHDTSPNQLESLRENIRRREVASGNRLTTNPQDGIIALITKWIFAFPCWRCLFRRFVPHIARIWGDLDLRRNAEEADAIVRRVMDLYIGVMSVLLVAAYFSAYAVAQARSEGMWKWGILVVCVAFSVYRLGEILSVFAELHLAASYSTPDAIRAVLNTIWHYLDFIIVFATLYVLASASTNDSFAEKGSLLDSPDNPIYFSLATMATVGYGDFSPKEAFGKCLVGLEVVSGLILIVVVIQRAISASHSQLHSTGKEQSHKLPHCQGPTEQILFERCSLFEPLEIHGYWWLPSSATNTFSGVLRFDGKRISLQTFGRLQSGNSRISSIYGQTKDGIPCTLCNSHLDDVSGRPYGITVAEYHSCYLLMGHHVADVDNDRFVSGTFAYTNIEEWSCDFPFDVTHNPSPGDPFVTTQITHRHPKPISVRVSSLAGSVELVASVTFRGPGHRSFSAEQSLFFQLTPDTPQSFEWFFEKHVQLQRLLTFFTDGPVATREFRIDVNPTTAGTTSEPTPSLLSTRTCSVVWHDDRRRGKDYEPRQSARMLVTLPDIRGRFGDVLERWMSNAERLKHVYNLFFSAVHTDSLYVDAQFLSLTQALEVYSRVARDSKYVTDAEYTAVETALNNAIPTQIDSSLKQSLRTRIQYGNRYSLRKRITNLLNELEDETIKMFCESRSSFTSSVVATRNFFVHYDDDTSINVIPTERLFAAVQSLRILLTILLLCELGFSELEARALISRADLSSLVNLVTPMDQEQIDRTSGPESTAS